MTGRRLTVGRALEGGDSGSSTEANPLYDLHVEEGARIVPFAGWEMPIQYRSGIREEHLFVRKGAGLFDVSHMGQLTVSGPGSLALLQHLVPRNLSTLKVGQLAYTVLCTESGGVLDDLAGYRLGEESYLLVVNASRVEEDFSWLQAQAVPMSTVDVSRAADRSMLALQGPRAEAAHLRDHKYWPPVARVDNTRGDRNLVCSCPPIPTEGADDLRDGVVPS